MKQLKNGTFKASNVTFNPITMEAHSYAWWQFVRVIEGKIVFNNYKYSNTTARHQWKVRRIMNDLGIVVDFEANTCDSLRTYESFAKVVRNSKFITNEQVKEAASKVLLKRTIRRHKALNDQGLYTENQWNLLRQGRSPSTISQLLI